MKQALLAVLLLFHSPFSTADLIIDSPLTFGEIVIRSNTAVSTLTVNRNGSTQSTNHILIIQPGSPGVFTIRDLPPYTKVDLSVDLPVSSAMNYPQTAQFTVTAVDLPSSINLDPSGSAQFKMGATLTTSGNPANQYYSGADYLMFLNINIDY